MKDCDVLPLIVDLMGSFYRSSRDALERASKAACANHSRHITGLTIFSEKNAETQATLETIIFSFLTVEATINYIFFNEQEYKTNQSGLDRWLKKKWKNGFSISDKFNLLFNKYATTDLDKLQNVTSLFYEFASFRNRIIHSYPEKYDALVEYSDIPGEILLHAAEPCNTQKLFPRSGLSKEIAKIGYPDAARCYEIMLIVLALIDAQFIAELRLPRHKNSVNKEDLITASPSEVLESLKPRYYPDIDPKTFAPMFDTPKNQ